MNSLKCHAKEVVCLPDNEVPVKVRGWHKQWKDQIKSFQNDFSENHSGCSMDLKR